MRIGIVGLGNMGGRIARRIAAAGYEIRGYDIDPAQVERAGIGSADAIATVVATSDTLLLSLPDSPVVEAVITGSGGILESCRPGQIVVDLTTAAPSSTVVLHRKLQERDVELVDAGISGGAPAAEVGTLTVMAGGSEAALERVRPVLETFSARIVHMGASGTGHTAKVLNNFLNGVNMTAAAEAFVAARKAGLDLGSFLEVVNASSGANWATVNRLPHIIEGDYLEGGLTGNLMLKDLLLYVDLAGSLGVPTLHAAGSVAAFGMAARLGYGEQISNRVVDAIGDVAGGVRLHGKECDEDQAGT
jgi:3-hydroxyisobutyrate dehydrogenase-like beta-hydroxyacid dehydrogenase